MTKYTAKDFANAQFAKHEDGQTARSVLQTSRGERWSYGGAFVLSDEQMARDGWVPVPSKPTITESEFKAALKESLGNIYYYAAMKLIELLGLEVIPDPEPTNTDRLTELIDDEFGFSGLLSIRIADHLDTHGVTAPNVKDN